MCRFLFCDGRDGSLRVTAGADAPRGGIASALLALTRELAGRGHDVTVVSGTERASTSGGVRFHPREELLDAAGDGVDAFVVVPDLLPLALPVAARCRIAWTGNAFAAGDPFLTIPYAWAPTIGKAGRVARLPPPMALSALVDRVVAKSRWQATRIVAAAENGALEVTVIGNGVALDLYRQEPAPAVPPRLVYTSQPRRGLPILLDLLPRVREQAGAVELHVYSYDPIPAEVRRRAPDGVVFHGALDKPALAGELRLGSVFAYPNTVRETFCTAVAEAQAAGLPVVTSDRGALAERVTSGEDGWLIPGEPTSDAYADAFVARLVSLLTDEETRRRMAGAARRRALTEYAWDVVAARWERLVSDLVTGRPATVSAPFAADALARDHDLSDRGATGRVAAGIVRAAVERALASYGAAGAALMEA